MEFSEEEIISYLNIYPYAKQKCAEIIEIKEYSVDKQRYNNTLEQFQNLNEMIVHLVDEWLSYLYEDEKEAIIFRFFRKLNYEQMAIKLNYSNHSCILKKVKKVIKKIERRMTDEQYYKHTYG